MSIERVICTRLFTLLALAVTPALSETAPEPVVSFGLSLDRAAYFSQARPESAPQLLARLTLRHALADPLRLDFPTPQVFDLVVRGERGEIVYQWSDDKFFPQVLHSETIVQGEKNYALSVRLADRGGAPLPPGSYLAEAWLTTSGGRFYAARVGFAIAHSPQSRLSPRRAIR